MSAHILFEPVNKARRSIGTAAPSSFWMKLTATMNTHDDVVTLTAADVPVLRALAIGAGQSDPSFHELVEAVEKYEAIRVWREF